MLVFQINIIILSTYTAIPISWMYLQVFTLSVFSTQSPKQYNYIIIRYLQ